MQQLAMTYEDASTDAGPSGKFGPKFPYAVVLQEDGSPVMVEGSDGKFKRFTISPKQYNPEIHEGHLGCEDCLAPLLQVGDNSAVGGEDRKSYFKSENLDDHKNCDLASPEQRVQKEAKSRLDFFRLEGPKLLYFNFKYPFSHPIFDPKYDSPLKKRDGFKRTGKEDTDVATYGVSSMKAFLRMAKHRDFSDPFYDDVSIYMHQKRLPWRKVMMGMNHHALLTNTFEENAMHVYQPKVAIVEIDKTAEVRKNPEGLYEVSCKPVSFPDKSDPSGFRQFGAQPIIQTSNQDVLDLITQGGSFAIQSVPSVITPKIQEITRNFRAQASNDNNIPVYMRLNSLNDVDDCSKYMESRMTLPAAKAVSASPKELVAA